VPAWWCGGRCHRAAIPGGSSGKAAARLFAGMVAGMVEGVDEPDPWLALGGPVGFCSGLGRLVGGCAVDELGAVVGEHGVDAVRHRRDQGVEEVGRGSAGSPLMELDKGELGGSVAARSCWPSTALLSILGRSDQPSADR
jgi:hypothetical protein